MALLTSQLCIQVGKVNAAIELMTVLIETKPDLLINYGTAGTIKSGLRILLKSAVQCDMDVRLLGIALGATPFETEQRFHLSDSPLMAVPLIALLHPPLNSAAIWLIWNSMHLPKLRHVNRFP